MITTRWCRVRGRGRVPGGERRHKITKITKPVKANLMMMKMMMMVLMMTMMMIVMMVMMPGGERRLPARVSKHGGRAPVHLQVVVLVHDEEDQ